MTEGHDAIPHRELVPVNEPLNHVASAVVKTAFYEGHLAMPARDGEELPLAINTAQAMHFLAWKAVQDGGRAALVVGKPVLEGERTPLPYTGFEGYLPVYLLPDDLLDSERVLAFADQFGIGPDGPREVEGLARLTPQQLVVLGIARVGERERERIESLCRTMADEVQARSAFEHALAGTALDERFGMAALGELATFFSEVLAKLRGLTEPFHDQVEAFREATYAELVPGLSYTLSAGQIFRRYTLIRSAVAAPETPVRMTRRDLDGYRLMARIGEWGDPLLRAALRLVPLP
jgi:hypothetical protein